MQTFLPYSSFIESAKCLDKKRCWKQVVEAKQILNTLSGQSKGWINHPAVKMWRGYESLLECYFQVFLKESLRRGIKVVKYTPKEMYDQHAFLAYAYPNWLGNNDFHNSHKSNLLRKDAIYYGRFGWGVTNNLEYIWPTN